MWEFVKKLFVSKTLTRYYSLLASANLKVVELQKENNNLSVDLYNKNNIVKHLKDSNNKNYDESSTRIRALENELAQAYEQLRRAKEAKNFTGAIDRASYKAKVLKLIGNGYLSKDEDPAFKLGIQFALRHFEEHCVQD
jgi:arginine deiminase